MVRVSITKKLAWAAALAILTLGCGNDPGPTADEQKIIESAEDLFAKGKAQLEAGEYELARGSFKTIISETEDPEDKEYVGTLTKWDMGELISKSRFSFVLADILFQTNNAVSQLSDILGILTDTGVLGAPSVVLTPAGRIEHYHNLLNSYAPMGAGGTDALIDNLLDDIRAPFAVWIDELVKVKDGGDFSIEFDDLPVKIGETTVMKMPGEYDMGEVYFILSLASFVAGTLDGIMALNMAVDIGTAIGPLLDFVGYQKEGNPYYLSFSENNPGIAKDILGLVSVLFYLNPSFLTVGDVSLVTRGADETADAFKYLSKMFEAVRDDAKAGDDQSNDIVGYFENAEDEIEYIELHFDLVLVVPIDGVDASKLENLQVELNDDFINALDNVETAFRGGGSARVEWERDIVPMISLAVVTILRTGVFDQLIADAAGDQVNELLGSGFLTPDVIGGVLTSVIPDVFRFNVGAIRENGGCGIRCILPVLTAPQNGYENDPVKRAIDNGDSISYEIVYHPFTEVSFVYEYECFDGLSGNLIDPLADGTFICSENNTIDSRHFENVLGNVFSYADENSVFTSDEPGNGIIGVAGSGSTAIYFDPQVTFTTEFTFGRDSFISNNEGYVPDAVKESPAISSADYESAETIAVWGINADGIDSRLPYIAFQDASLGGLIEFSFSNANLSGDALKAMDDLNAVDVWTDGSTPKGRLSRAMNGLISVIAANVVSFIPSE